MRTPSASALLQVWEHGQDAQPAARALLLLTLAASADPAGLAVGARNRQLLTLQRELFGPLVEAVADCPDCGVVLELPLAAEPGPDRPCSGAETEREVCRGGWMVRFRPPTAGDLIGLPDPPGDAVTALLARCVLAADREGVPVAPADLPADVVQAVDEAMAAADPDSVLDVAASCPACGRSFVLPLEPVAFLWSRLDQWAWRQLADVHDLARLFGWTEDTVLAMTPWRRRAYLALAAP
jgi:hypothetical protein